MKKLLLMGFIVVVLLPITGCEVSVDGEKVIDFSPNKKHTTICGQNMVFFRERDTDMHSNYWSEVHIRNTYDQGSHVILSDGHNVYLDTYISNFQDAHFPGIYIPDDGHAVIVEIKHYDGWQWYSCSESGTELHL